MNYEEAFEIRNIVNEINDVLCKLNKFRDVHDDDRINIQIVDGCGCKYSYAEQAKDSILTKGIIKALMEEHERLLAKLDSIKS